MSLITLAEYKLFAGIASDDTARDSMLAALIAQVEKRAQKYCKLDLEEPTEDALIIYCDASDATSATVQVTATAMILTIAGGTKAGITTIIFADADKDTLTELVAAIEALDGWKASLLGTGSDASTNLIILAATGCKGIGNAVTLDIGIEITEYFDGDGGDCIVPKYFPVNEVVSLYDDPDREYGSNYLIDPSDYVVKNWGALLSPTSGALMVEGLKFERGVNNIKLVYRGGYGSLQAVPEDLKLAICKAVSWNDQRKGKESLNSQNVASQNLSTQYVTELPQDIKDDLAPYRKIQI